MKVTYTDYSHSEWLRKRGGRYGIYTTQTPPIPLVSPGPIIALHV